MRVTLICEHCGQPFERLACNVKPSKKTFCSKECQKKYRESLRQKRQCKQCGREFEILTSVLEKSNASGNFCGRKCYNEYLKTLTGEKNKSYKRIATQCPNCHKEIFIVPSRVEMYKNSFCSYECKNSYMKNYIGGELNVNWKGGFSRYRGNFKEVKRKYFSRPQFCALCGTTKRIHIHHIIPYRLTQDNSKDNLIPLCVKHHKIVECASLLFINLMMPDRLDRAKEYINLMLRPKQQLTAYRIIEAQNEAKN